MQGIRWFIVGVVFFMGILMPASSLRAEEADAPPQITADAAILIEASTGRVLYEKNADEPHFPASTTKMMTCLLALENGNPDVSITVSPTAANIEDTELLVGDKLKLSELLQEMMLRSDNGAAEAVAEYLASSDASFADKMNKKAQALGASHTQFRNPHGLPDSQHYSTARDMALIAAYGMKNPAFRKLVGQKEKTIYWQYPVRKSVKMENTNEMLGAYDGMTGIKTGFTKAAGGCLAASACRDGVELIAVVLHASDAETRFTDAKKLLDYGFPRVQTVRGMSREDAECHVWVRGGQEGRMTARPAKDLMYPLLDGEDKTHYSARYDIPSIVDAPIQAGQQLGNLVLLHDGTEVGSIPLLADQAVEPGFSFLSLFVRLAAVFTGH